MKFVSLVFVVFLSFTADASWWKKKLPKMPAVENPYKEAFRVYDCKANRNGVEYHIFKCKVDNMFSRALPFLTNAKNYDHDGILLRQSRLEKIASIKPNETGYVEVIVPVDTKFIVIEIDEQG
jgi:hypothetical protein